MASDETGRLLNEIGRLLAEDKEYPLDGTLLYAKVWPDAVSGAVFKDGGDHVAYQDGPGPLMDMLLDLWEETNPPKRWAEMEYAVRGGTFDASFTYSQEINPEDDPFDRRDRIVKRRFGDKPIVYPPMSMDDELFQL